MEPAARDLVSNPYLGMKMVVDRTYIEQNRPAIVDWVVFSASMLMGFAFPSLAGIGLKLWVSKVMLAAVVLYTLGAWLKRLPLYYRIIVEKKGERYIPYEFFLIVGHWLVLMIVVMLSIPAARMLVGLTPGSLDEIMANLSGIAYCSLVSAGITAIVFWPKKKFRGAAAYHAAFRFRRELVADCFLIISITIFTFAFWEKGVMVMFDRPINNVSDIFYSFLTFGACYVLFYLPLRFLYLVEDHSHNQTWKRLLIIFSLVLLRALLVVVGW